MALQRSLAVATSSRDTAGARAAAWCVALLSCPAPRAFAVPPGAAPTAARLRAQRLPAHRRRRQRDRAARAFGNGPGHLDRAADADRRGARRRLVEDPGRARARRAGVRAHGVRHADDRRLARAPGRVRPLPPGRRRRARRCWCRPRPRRAGSVPAGEMPHRERRSVIAGDASASATASSPTTPASCPPPDETLTLKDPKEWKLIGKPTRRLDTPEKITGRAQFGMDVQFDGLLTAVVARAPVFGGNGEVVRRDRGQGRARRAQRGAGAQRRRGGRRPLLGGQARPRCARGRLGPRAEGARSTARRCARSSRKLAATPGRRAAQAGDVAAALATAAKTSRGRVCRALSRACADGAAQLHGRRSATDQCEIWTGTQFQTIDQVVAAKITGLKPEQVQIHTMFLGGGFGRRATPTLRLRQRSGARRQGGEGAGQDGVDARGRHPRRLLPARVRAARQRRRRRARACRWRGSTASSASRSLAGTPFEPMMVKNGIDATSVEGAADSPYLKDIPDHRVDLHSPKTGDPGAVVALGRPQPHRLRDGEPDRRAGARRRQGSGRVPPRAAEEPSAPPGRARTSPRRRPAGARRWPQGRARGIAVHESFGSFVAQVAEVSASDGRARSACTAWSARSTAASLVNPRHDRARRWSRRHRLRPRRGAARRAQLQGRPRAAVELPRLPGAAPERDAEGARCTSCRAPRSLGRRRTRHAADRAGGGQRGVRPDRPAPARAAAATCRHCRLPEEVTVHATLEATASPPACWAAPSCSSARVRRAPRPTSRSARNRSGPSPASPRCSAIPAA